MSLTKARDMARLGERWRVGALTSNDPNIRKSYFKKSIEYFNEALEQDEDYPWALAHRGAAKTGILNLCSAKDDLTRALELDPGYIWAYAHRGDVFRQLSLLNEGFLQLAFNDYNRALEQSKKYPWAFAHLGAMYARKAEIMILEGVTSECKKCNEIQSILLQAEEYLKKAIEIDNAYSWANGYLGTVTIMLGDIEIPLKGEPNYSKLAEAASYFSAWMYLEQDIRKYLYEQSFTFMVRSNDSLGAKSLAARLLDERPNNVPYMLTYAEILRHSKDMEQFDEIVNKINYAIDNPEGYSFALASPSFESSMLTFKDFIPLLKAGVMFLQGDEAGANVELKNMPDYTWETTNCEEEIQKGHDEVNPLGQDDNVNIIQIMYYHYYNVVLYPAWRKKYLG